MSDLSTPAFGRRSSSLSWVALPGAGLALMTALMTGGGAAAAPPPSVPPPRADATLAIVGAAIYPAPGAPPLPAGSVVVVRGGRIAAMGSRKAVAVPAGATVLDATGLTVTAGFQNSHMHFAEPKWDGAAQLPAARLESQLREMLTRYGFTTVVDTGSAPGTVDLRRRIEAGEVAGPRILTAGIPLYPENGIPFYLQDMPPAILSMLAQPKSPAEAAAVVEERVRQGADFIKLFTGSWVRRGTVLPMRTDIATAAVAAAHRHGMLVFTHPSSVAGLQVALDAHVDVLAHAIEDMRGWDDAYLDKMLAAHMTLIPTLHLFRQDDDLPGILHEVGTFSRRGGQILFGTDAGFLPDYDTADEMALMQKAGMTFPAILAALTTAPAERFGEAARRGRVAPGMDGDLVVLSGDPAQDIGALARVRYTIRHGRIIYDSSATTAAFASGAAIPQP